MTPDFGSVEHPSLLEAIHSETTSLRIAVARREYRQRCVVSVNFAVANCMAAHCVDQRIEQPIRPPSQKPIVPDSREYLCRC